MKKPPFARKATDDIVALSIMPIIKAQTWCFGIFNIFLGAGLYNLHPTKTLIVASAAWTFKLWAILFVGTGLAMIYAMLRKAIRLLRSLILVAIFMKVTWFAALIIRIGEGGTFFFAALWGLVMALQVVQYIYYFSDKPKPIQ